MRLARTVAEARGVLAELRRGGRRVAFVPTMGALHAGHRSLVERAAAARPSPAIALSVFVNPLQFGPGEDYAAYPRDLERDAALARAWDVALLFAPDARELTPPGAQLRIAPGPLGEELEGASRPGHFEGVLTIVAKLFNVVQPDLTVFGQKDLQQAVLVGTLVRELHIPLELIVAPTVREPDGLALSSRNAYFSPEERAQAPVLHRALRAGAATLRRGERSADRIAEEVRRVLGEAPDLRPDYVAVRRAEDLAAKAHLAGPVAILAAVRLGETRLIDNLITTPEGEADG